MRRQAKIDGITEPVIFRETAKLHGLTTDRSDFERFAAALTEEHLAQAVDLRERGHALPGAAAALDLLAVYGIQQTVVSGNVRPVAEIKLQVFGLDRHILWDLGAYGEDNDLRAELVRMSLQRADALPVDAVLIGDTRLTWRARTRTVCASSPWRRDAATRSRFVKPARRPCCQISWSRSCW